MMQLILPGWTVVPFHYLHEEVAIVSRQNATLVFDVRAQFGLQTWIKQQAPHRLNMNMLLFSAWLQVRDPALAPIHHVLLHS